MEIIGTVVALTDKFLRIRTVLKKQQIDIFYPESKSKAMKWRFEPQMITHLEVEPQEFEVDGIMYAKLWFKYVISPENMSEENCYFDAAKKIRIDMMVLYRDKNPK